MKKIKKDNILKIIEIMISIIINYVYICFCFIVFGIFLIASYELKSLNLFYLLMMCISINISIILIINMFIIIKKILRGKK